MKVYVLENIDRSGVFSTREKAIESARHCAERCEWIELECKLEPWGAKMSFAYYNPVITQWQIADVTVLEYELDEDNG